MRVGIYALLVFSAGLGASFAPLLSAQNQPAPPAAQEQPDLTQPPLNPVDQRDQEIRQIDPLDRTGKDRTEKNKNTNGKDKTDSKQDQDAARTRLLSQGPSPRRSRVQPRAPVHRLFRTTIGVSLFSNIPGRLCSAAVIRSIRIWFLSRSNGTKARA